MRGFNIPYVKYNEVKISVCSKSIPYARFIPFASIPYARFYCNNNFYTKLYILRPNIWSLEQQKSKREVNRQKGTLVRILKRSLENPEHSEESNFEQPHFTEVKLIDESEISDDDVDMLRVTRSGNLFLRNSKSANQRVQPRYTHFEVVYPYSEPE